MGALSGGGSASPAGGWRSSRRFTDCMLPRGSRETNQELVGSLRLEASDCYVTWSGWRQSHTYLAWIRTDRSSPSCYRYTGNELGEELELRGF